MAMLHVARGTLVFLVISRCVATTPEPTTAPTPRPTFDDCTSDYQCAEGEACKRGRCKVTCASRFPNDAACGPGKRINLAERVWVSEEGVPKRMVDEEKCCQDLGDGDIFVAAAFQNCEGDEFIDTLEECEQAKTELQLRFSMEVQFVQSSVFDLFSMVPQDTANEALAEYDEYFLKGCQVALSSENRATIFFNPNAPADVKPQWGSHRLICKTKQCISDSDCPAQQHVCSNNRCKACHEFSEESCPGQCQWESKSFPFNGKGECTEQCSSYDYAARCPAGRCHWDGLTCEDSCATKNAKTECDADTHCFWDGDQCLDQVFTGLWTGIPAPQPLQNVDCGFHMESILVKEDCKEACFTIGQNMEWVDVDPASPSLPHGCIVNMQGTACMFNSDDGLTDTAQWSEWEAEQMAADFEYEVDHLSTFYYPVCKVPMCTCKNGRGAIGVEQECGEHGAAVCHLCDMVAVGEHPYLLDPVFHNCEATEDWIVFQDNAYCDTYYSFSVDDDTLTGADEVMTLKECIDATLFVGEDSDECDDIYVSTNIPKVGGFGRRRSQYCECMGDNRKRWEPMRSKTCSVHRDDPTEENAATEYILRHACHTFTTSHRCPQSYCEWRARGEPYTTGDHYHEGCFEAQTRLCPPAFPVCWHTGNCVSEECSSRNNCEMRLNEDYIDGNGNGREAWNKCNGDHQTCTTEDGASIFSFDASEEPHRLQPRIGYRPHDAGHACRFPFVYKGILHHSCTLAGFGSAIDDELEERNLPEKYSPRVDRPWCATGTGHRDWGFCDMDSSPTCSKTRSVACSTKHDCPSMTPYCNKGLCQESGWVVAMRQASCDNLIPVQTDWRARLTLNQCMKMVGTNANCGNFMVYSEEDAAYQRNYGSDYFREALREEFENRRKDAERRNEHLLGTIQYGSYCGCVPYGESCVRRPIRALYPKADLSAYAQFDIATRRRSSALIQKLQYHEITVLKQASCPDDSASWFWKKEDKNCDWVASEPKSRCHVKGNMDGQRVYASSACPTTCGGCGQCLNDPNWRLRAEIPRMNRDYEDDDNLDSLDHIGCMWVGKKRSRCSRYGRDAFGHRVSAREACCKACSKFFDEGRRLNSDIVV